MAQQIHFTPDFSQIHFTPEEDTSVSTPPVHFTPDTPTEERDTGLLGRLTQPLTTAPSRIAGGIAEYIDQPSLERSPMRARIQGFGAGALEGLGDLISGLTSPLDLALLATTGGAAGAARKGLTGLTKGLNVATRVGGGAVGIEGGHRIATAEDPGDIGQGLLELVGGAAGGFGRLPGQGARSRPLIKPDIDTPKVKPTPEVTPVVSEEVVAAMSPQNKLLQVLEEARPLNKEQQKLYRIERARKAAKAENVPIRTEEDAHKFMSRLKGKHSRVNFEGIRTKLEQTDIDSLFKTIGGHPELAVFEKARSVTALKKLLDGEVPQKNEITLLQKVFGDEFTTELGRRLPKVDKRKAFLAEAVNLPRGIMASFDLSAPFRQGIGLVHKKEFWKSFNHMFKALGSEKAFKAARESVEMSPSYDLGIDSKLALTDLLSLSTREEAIMSTWAEQIPLGIGKGVRASNRAYVAFLNKLRMDTFNDLVGKARKAGRDPETNRVLAGQIADFVNTATGRGNLGRLEKHAVLLNSTLFSPRMIASRVKMLNPNYYVQADPLIRKEALKSLLAVAGFGGSLVSLGKAAGGDVELDPTSSDFGKLKIGDTRLDPYGGFQQYIVAASRLVTGQSKSPVTGRTTDLTGGQFGRSTRKDIVQRFGEGKLHPAVSFVVAILEGKDFAGQPTSVPKEVATRFTPIMLQDLYELAQEDPQLIPFMMPPAVFGMGSQTFQER